MMRFGKPSIMWAHVGGDAVFNESWGLTEAWARRETDRILGKQRAKATGELCLVRVTVEPLSTEEVAAYRAEQEAWLAKRKGIPIPVSIPPSQSADGDGPLNVDSEIEKGNA
jgi:hypothetical protein